MEFNSSKMTLAAYLIALDPHPPTMCMGQKLKTLNNGLGIYLKQLICKRLIFGPIVKSKQCFNVEN